MPKSTTKRSTPKLSDLARHVVAPKGIVATGWPAVKAKCSELGISFRPWQPDVGRLILSKRADGKYAATIGGTGLSIPRQVGKTFLVGAIVFALCLLRPNLTVIWTAHRLRTAEETFGKMRAFAKRKKIAPHVLKIVLGSGEEAILFRNDSRILFGARESGFGLGFDEVDVLIFDEAQRLKDSTLDDMIPAANQSRQSTSALLLFMGTPPRPTDPGEVFGRMRREALSGDDSDTGWVEFGCEPGFTPTPAPAPLTEADWKQVAKANPSFPDDTPREAILRMRKKLGPDSFRREGLGQWDDDEDDDPGDRIDPNTWGDLGDDGAALKEGSRVTLALAVSTNRRWSTIAVCGTATDGRRLVMVKSMRRTAGVVEALVELKERHRPLDIALDPATAAGSLLTDLRDAGLEVHEITSREAAQSTGAMIDAVDDGRVVHTGQAELDKAVEVARTRIVGEAMKWDARGNADPSPIQAASIAYHRFAQLASNDYDPLDSVLI